MVKKPQRMVTGVVTEIKKISKSPAGTLTKKKINIATAARHEIIAASAGKKHKIVKMVFVCAGEVGVTLEEGGTAITGVMPFAAGGGLGFDGDFNPLEIAVGQAFNITLSAAVQVSGWVQYITE